MSGKSGEMEEKTGEGGGGEEGEERRRRRGVDE